MRQFLIAIAILIGLSGPLKAQNAEIEGVISDQIDAFLADDFARAFTFASPMIRNLFGTPENFGTMVRRGYPMVWRPADVRYLDQREVDGATWQLVRITDAKGSVHLLAYQMINTENGWKINGVQFVDAPAAAA